MRSSPMMMMQVGLKKNLMLLLLPCDHGGGGVAGEIKKREEIKIEHVRTIYRKIYVIIDFSSSILVYKNYRREKKEFNVAQCYYTIGQLKR